MQRGGDYTKIPVCFYSVNELKEAIKMADQTVKSILAISYYSNSKKVTTKPLTNGWNIQKLSIGGFLSEIEKR